MRHFTQREQISYNLGKKWLFVIPYLKIHSCFTDTLEFSNYQIIMKQKVYRMVGIYCMHTGLCWDKRNEYTAPYFSEPTNICVVKLTCSRSLIALGIKPHWERNKKSDISRTKFSIWFSWGKYILFCFIFQWQLNPRFQLTRWISSTPACHPGHNPVHSHVLP